MRFLIPLFIGLFSFQLTIQAAVPSLSGPSGLVTIPTAESLKYKQINAGYDSVMGNDSAQDDWSYKVNLGAYENWEVGIVGGRVPSEGVFLNLKYHLMSDNQQLPLSIAIGSENISSSTRSTIYMVASKYFREDFGTHLGFKAIFSDEVLPMFMGGVNYMVSDELEVLGDVDGDGYDYTFNIGARYYIKSDIAIKANVIDFTSAKSNNPTFSLGISASRFL